MFRCDEVQTIYLNCLLYLSCRQVPAQSRQGLFDIGDCFVRFDILVLTLASAFFVWPKGNVSVVGLACYEV